MHDILHRNVRQTEMEDFQVNLFHFYIKGFYNDRITDELFGEKCMLFIIPNYPIKKTTKKTKLYSIKLMQNFNSLTLALPSVRTSRPIIEQNILGASF